MKDAKRHELREDAKKYNIERRLKRELHRRILAQDDQTTDEAKYIAWLYS